MQRATLIASLAALMLIGAGCSWFGGSTPTAPKPVALEYWRTEDDATTFQPAIDAYRKLHPHVTITVKTMRNEGYERALLEALAVNRGPDMFSIPNVWIGAWRTKLLPMPKETVIATQGVNADKKIVTANRKMPAMTVIQMRDAYVEGAARDLILHTAGESENEAPSDKIYGLPLSYGTLALFYNKDLFKKAGYDKPPETWRDVQEQAGKMTVLDKDGNIVTAGAALGGSTNVRYAADILADIMRQNGADLTNSSGTTATFNIYPSGGRGSRTSPPGLDALLFYQGFANQGSLGYSWNDSMPLSLDAFVGGRAAMYFGYPEDARDIRDRAPRLDFALAPMPQIDPAMPKNLARYPVEVVSRKSAHPNEAWNFIQFMAATEQVSPWLTATKRPTALRANIAAQLTDPEIAPFAGQVLTGRAWYKGKDWQKVEDTFNLLIAFRPLGRNQDYQNALNQAASVVNSTY